MSDIVLFKDISKHFGNVVALDKITLSVKEGEFLSLLGPSGCGKTTLLRTLAGLEKPTMGQVFLEGKDVTWVPSHKRPVNMVFQRWALFPHKTVAENIAFGLEIKKVPAKEIVQKVGRILNLVKMEGYEDRYPRQLSGGQAQRIALARALVMEPKVLLLDEPLGSLDLKLRKEMQIELIHLHDRLGMTFIYVTHDQEEALTMSDRIVVIKQGVIVQEGTPTDIYQHPNSIFSAQFIGETILFSGKVISVDSIMIQIDTGSFILLGGNPGNIAAGEEATISIRPERISIHDQADPQFDNLLSGKILNTIFKGSAVHYQVEVASNQVITVQQNLAQDTPLYHSGETVCLGWLAENSVVLTH